MPYKIRYEPDPVENVTASVIRDICTHMQNHFSNGECGRCNLRENLIIGDRRIDVRFTLDATEVSGK